MDSKIKKVIFVSSTGGHLTELMQLEPLMKLYDSYIVTENQAINKNLDNKYKYYYLLHGTRNKKLLFTFKFIINILISFYLFVLIRPKVIISTGAHTAVPLAFIGKIFGSKIIFIETFAKISTPSLAGKVIYRISSLFMVQWESMKKVYPKAFYKGSLL